MVRKWAMADCYFKHWCMPTEYTYPDAYPAISTAVSNDDLHTIPHTIHVCFLAVVTLGKWFVFCYFCNTNEPAFSQILSRAVYDTDNPMTIYGHSGKLCYMLPCLYNNATWGLLHDNDIITRVDIATEESILLYNTPCVWRYNTLCIDALRDHVTDKFIYIYTNRKQRFTYKTTVPAIVKQGWMNT